MGDKQQCSHLCLIFRYGRVLLHAKELKSFYDVYISVVFMLKTELHLYPRVSWNCSILFNLEHGKCFWVWNLGYVP